MKQTEIGLIPDDWKEHTLRDLIDILTDYTANGSFESLARNVRYLEYPSYARLIRLTDIRTNFTNEGVYVSKYSYDFLKKSSLHGGELLLANVGAYAGFSFIYPENLMFRGTLGPNMFLIKFFNQKIDNTFAYYAFSHGAVYNQLISKAASSAQPKLNKEDVRTCYINIPSSIQEQQRIAKALSDVDALISTTEKLIQKKKNIKQGTMQNLLTGKKRLPGFAKSTNYKQTELGPIPEDWEVKNLGEIFEFRPNNTFTRDCLNDSKGKYQNVHYGDVLIKYPSILDCSKETIPFINEGINVKFSKYGIVEGDIIIADTAEDETVGKVVEVFNLGEKKIVSGLHTFLCRKITDDFAPKWLGYFMNQAIFHNQLLPFITGTKVSAISRTAIQNVKVLIPSKEEQTAIANVLSSMDKEIETLNTKLEKYINLKTAMMQQLLTGKIRL